jgi:ACS family hexuronate transporter-like MFS transporter
MRFFGDSSGYFFLFWMPEYLVSGKGFSFAAAGALAWILPCFSDLGALLGGYLSGLLVRRGFHAVLARKIMMTAAAVIVCAGTLLQASPEVWLTIVSLSICTFGVGVWASNLHSLPADAFGSRVAATAHGLAGTFGALGGMVFNSIVGRLAAHAN